MIVYEHKKLVFEAIQIFKNLIKGMPADDVFLQKPPWEMSTTRYRTSRFENQNDIQKRPTFLFGLVSARNMNPQRFQCGCLVLTVLNRTFEEDVA